MPVETCACPHCETSYPFVDKLVGRPVRCRKCGGVFKVDPHAKAWPVIANQPPPEPRSGAHHRAVTQEDDGPQQRTAVDSGKATRRHPREGSTRFRRDVGSKGRWSTSRIMNSMRRSLLASSDEHPVPRDLRGEGGDGTGSTGSGSAEDDEDLTAAVDAAVADYRERPEVSSLFKGHTSGVFDDLVIEETSSRPTPGIGTSPGSSTRFARRRPATGSRRRSSSSMVAAIRASTQAIRQHQSQRRKVEPGRTTSAVRRAIAADLPSGCICPHCAAVIPLDADMVGTTRDCGTCGGSFRIFEDGSSAPAIANRPPTTRRQVRETGKNTAGKSAPAASRIMRTKDLMAQMAGRMQNLEKEIVASGAAPAVATTTEGQEERERRTRRTPTLTGEGEEAGRLVRRAVAVLVVVAVLVAGTVLLAPPPAPERVALRAATGDLTARDDEIREHLRTFRDRCWRSGAVVRPVIDCDRAELGPGFSGGLAELAPVIELTRGRYLHRPSGLWVPAAEYERIAGRWERTDPFTTTPEGFRRRLVAESVEVVADEAVRRTLAGCELPGRVRGVVAAIFADTPPGSVYRRLFATDPPEALEGRSFHGERGILLLPVGDAVRRDYRGLLVRFEDGDRWTEWRIFALAAADDDESPAPVEVLRWGKK